jgi:hypothetical protein
MRAMNGFVAALVLAVPAACAGEAKQTSTPAAAPAASAPAPSATAPSASATSAPSSATATRVASATPSAPWCVETYDNAPCVLRSYGNRDRAPAPGQPLCLAARRRGAWRGAA